jgi:hypothetical protein
MAEVTQSDAYGSRLMIDDHFDCKKLKGRIFSFRTAPLVEVAVLSLFVVFQRRSNLPMSDVNYLVLLVMIMQLSLKRIIAIAATL